MIDVKDLNFTYPGGKSEALKHVSFGVKPGEIFGFLGPSGAGKSTTQKILTGQLTGYKGHVSVMGKGVSAWKADYYEKVGVSFEIPNHYLKLTAKENLDYFASLTAPFIAMIFAAFARNKVEGMAIQKMLGGVFMIPVVAYFIHSDWQFLFGVFPTYWMLKAFWVACKGGQGFWLYMIVGVLVHAVFIGLLLKRFDKVMHR